MDLTYLCPYYQKDRHLYFILDYSNNWPSLREKLHVLESELNKLHIDYKRVINNNIAPIEYYDINIPGKEAVLYEICDQKHRFIARLKFDTI